jgi:hypothetical protein
MEVIALREDDRVVASLHQQQQPSLQSSSLIHVPAAAVGTVLAVGDRGIERVVVVDREGGGGGGGGGDRNAERGFMISARTHALVQQSTASLRTLSSKRKLEEFEIGMAESAISAASQVRVTTTRILFLMTQTHWASNCHVFVLDDDSLIHLMMHSTHGATTTV